MAHGHLSFHTPDGAPRSAEDLSAALSALCAGARHTWVDCDVRDVSPAVLHAVQRLHAAGRKVRLCLASGVAWPADAPTPDVLQLTWPVGAAVPPRHATPRQELALPLASAHLLPEVLHEAVQTAAAWHGVLVLRPPEAPPPLADLAQACATLLRLADAADVALHTRHAVGLGPEVPTASPRAPAPVTENLLRLLRDGLPYADRAAGCTLAGADAVGLCRTLAATGDREPVPSPRQAQRRLGLWLAAQRCVAVDRPPSDGGPGRGRPQDHPRWRPSPCAGQKPRLAVLNPPSHDKITAFTTLPALVRALRELGADVHEHTVWPFTAEHPFDGSIGQAKRDAFDAEDALWASFDAPAYDQVIVPGWAAARRVAAHMTPQTRLVVVDLHLLEGIDTWLQRFPTWPHHLDITVVSCFPGYARSYRRRGVPAERVLWRPFPLDLTVFRPGPAPESAPRAFCGGNQRRDLQTLTLALAAAESAPALDLITTQAMDLHTAPQSVRAAAAERLHRHPTTDLLGFYRALSHSRLVVLPLHPDPHGAAGLTILAMALAAGRPVLTTVNEGTADHVQHGRQGLLVPPQAPKALASAWDWLETPSAGTGQRPLTAMAQASRTAGQRLSVRRWAHDLLHGAPPRAVRGRAGVGWRPW